MVKFSNARVRVIRRGNFKKKDQATGPATAGVLCQLQAQDYCAQPGRSRAFKWKPKQKEEHSEVNGHLERSSQNTNSDRPDGKKWTPTHPSPDSASLGKQGIGQILHLVPEASKISDSSSKKCQATTMGQGLS